MVSMYDSAIFYIEKLGWYLIPIPPGKKGPTGKGWNKPENAITTREKAIHWIKNPNDNMGVLLGSSKIITLDVDDLDNTKSCFSSFGWDYEDLIAGAPRIKTRSGHDKAIFLAPPDINLDKVVLSWPIQGEAGEQVVFELRAGDKFQDVLPPSIHPDTKKPYEWLVPPTGKIPEIPKELLLVWMEWNKFKHQFEAACPWSIKKEPKQKKARTGKPEDDLIGWYNQSVPIATLLEKYGCHKKGERYLSPTSTTKIPGIIIFLEENRFYSHHPAFFGDGLPHDAFDLFLKFECGGDQSMAISKISTMKYQKEISHGKDIADTIMAPPPEIPDEDFTLKVPPNENLLTKWQEFGFRTQDSYPEYHLAGMMVLISHLIKAEMRPQYGTVGNNMWCIILGSSGTSGKSTACNALMALTYTEELMPYVFRLTNKITPEAFTAAFAEHQRRIHHSDECAGFLKFLKRDYAADLADDIIKAYDGQAIGKTTIGLKGKGGAVVAQHPRISMIWNTVPDVFGEVATRDQFNSGFFLRPFFIMPQRQKGMMRDAPLDSYCQDLKEEIIIKLANLCRVIGSRMVVFEESEYINNWKHNLRIESAKNGRTDAEKSALSRIYEQARKAAMNLTIASTDFYNFVMETGKGDGDLVGLTEIHYEIPDKYAKIACDWAENVFYRTSLRALKLTYAGGNYGKVIKLLEDGQELTRTDIGNIIKRSGRQISEFLSDLCLDYPVESHTLTLPGSKKPTTYYYLPRRHEDWIK